MRVGRRSLASTLVLLAAAISPAAAHSRSGSQRSCQPAGARVLFVHDAVRVYRPARSARTFACHSRRSRTALTADWYEQLAGPRAFAVAGNSIAYATLVYDDGLDGDIPYTYIARTTLGAAARRSPTLPARVGPSGELNTPERQWNVDLAVSDIVLPSADQVAWIACPASASHDRCSGGTRTVYASSGTRQPQIALDSSSRIASRSLRLRNDQSTLSWLHGGRLRTAPFPGTS